MADTLRGCNFVSNTEAMISIDFKLDEAVLAEDLMFVPSTVNAAALEETYFVMPVRLCVCKLPQSSATHCWR